MQKGNGPTGSEGPNYAGVKQRTSAAIVEIFVEASFVVGKFAHILIPISQAICRNRAYNRIDNAVHCAIAMPVGLGKAKASEAKNWGD